MELGGLDAEYLGQSLALLVSDALAFTHPLSREQQELLAAALREVAVGKVTEESEKEWFRQMLDLNCTTIAGYPEPTGP